jgi:hypothetical protein
MPTTHVPSTTNYTTGQIVGVAETLYILEGSISINSSGTALFGSSVAVNSFLRIVGGNDSQSVRHRKRHLLVLTFDRVLRT